MIINDLPAGTRRLPPETEEQLDQVLQNAVETEATSGVEALVLSGDDTVYHKACGFLRRIPTPIPLPPDTYFDLASLTKMVSTTTSVMILVDHGLVRLDAPVWSYIPEFGCKGKERITVRNLLTHTAGLLPFIQLYRDHSGKKAFYQALAEMEPPRPPGVEREYSDLGFMTLGWMVEQVSGKPLDEFAREHIFTPLGMRNTLYNPPRALWKQCAATEDCPFRKRIMQGQVHDENAYQMGGVSGHAGLFSTADDLALFVRMMLYEGRLEVHSSDRVVIPPTPTLPRQGGGSALASPPWWRREQFSPSPLAGEGRGGGEVREIQILSRATFREMLTPQPMPQGAKQALGWWFKRPPEEATVFLPSEYSYGHTGFTGTSLWIDPVYKTAVVLLSNAVHPKRETGHAAIFRKSVHTIVSEWCVKNTTPSL